MNVLVELAAQAENQPPPPGSGPYSYIHTRGWYLATDQMTDGRILDARIEETEREFWVAGDGRGRIEETRNGRRAPMSGVYGPGGLSSGPSAQEAAGQPPSPPPGGWTEDVRSTWLAQAVSPELQAVLLRRLATQPGLQLSETTDRVGRPGLAVRSEDPRKSCRHVLVLDATTGMLLAAEEIVLRAGGLPVRAPATVSYTCWLGSGYTTDSDSRP